MCVHTFEDDMTRLDIVQDEVHFMTVSDFLVENGIQGEVGLDDIYKMRKREMCSVPLCLLHTTQHTCTDLCLFRNGDSTTSVRTPPRTD